MKKRKNLDFQFTLENSKEPAFPNWKLKDFRSFVAGNVEFGRENIRSIAAKIPGKSFEEVENYSKVFWRRFEQIENFPSIIKRIERGEAKLRKVQRVKKILNQKVCFLSRQEKTFLDFSFLRSKFAETCRPLVRLEIPFYRNFDEKFSAKDDRFILSMIHRFGLDFPNLSSRIIKEIQQSSRFFADSFFKNQLPSVSRRQTDISPKSNFH